MSKVVGMVVLEVPPTLKVGIIKYLRKYRIRGGGEFGFGVWLLYINLMMRLGGLKKRSSSQFLGNHFKLKLSSPTTIITTIGLYNGKEFWI